MTTGALTVVVWPVVAPDKGRFLRPALVTVAEEGGLTDAATVAGGAGVAFVGVDATVAGGGGISSRSPGFALAVVLA